MLEEPFSLTIKSWCLSRVVTSLERVDLEKREVYSEPRLVKASDVSWMGVNFDSSSLEGLLSYSLL